MDLIFGLVSLQFDGKKGFCLCLHENPLIFLIMYRLLLVVAEVVGLL